MWNFYQLLYRVGTELADSTDGLDFIFFSFILHDKTEKRKELEKEEPSGRFYNEPPIHTLTQVDTQVKTEGMAVKTG